MSGSYRSVERAALCIGLFEVAFLILVRVLSGVSDGEGHVQMFMGDVHADQFFEGMFTPKLQHSDFLFLVAANIGAVSTVVVL